MNSAGGWDKMVVDREAEIPADMYNTGMIVVHTQNQCDCFESPKNTQVVRAPRLNQTDAGDAVNDGGWK
jgi:hypothetical protein